MLFIPLKGRRYWFVPLILCLLTIATGFMLYREQKADWAAVPGATFKAPRDENGKAAPGAWVRLLDLTTPSRKHVILSVAPVDLDEIRDLDNWRRNIGDSANLVNSVDEYRRNDGGISERIARGCGLVSLDPLKDRPLLVGEVTTEDCKQDKPYYGIGIRKIFDIPLVLWEGNSARRVCQRNDKVDKDGFSLDEKYIGCISESILLAVRQLLANMKEENFSTPLLLPALATGTGAINPHVVYQAYGTVIQEKLDTDAPLPASIIFIFSPHWTASRLAEHEHAMAALATELSHNWTAKSAKYRQSGPLASVFGVLCGLTVLSIFIVVGLIPIIDVSHKAPRTGFLGLLLALIGWGLAAQGGIALFNPLLGTSTWVSFFFVGLFAVAAAWVIVRAKRVFEESARGE